MHPGKAYGNLNKCVFVKPLQTIWALHTGLLWRGLAVLPVIICCMALPKQGAAQAADSLGMLRQFMQVCNSYCKQVPLHANITVRNAASVVTKPAEDTGMYTIEFFIQDSGAYIKMGPEEELVNDSLMLFISHSPKQMILYPNTGHVAGQMGNFAAAFMVDSNLQKFSAKYQVVMLPAGNTSLARPSLATIAVKSRALVPGTVLPKETIQVTYAPATNQPVEIVQLHRKMVLLDSANYNKLAQNPEYASKLVHTGGRYSFLIKEVSSTYTFNQIDYSSNIRLPLQMQNCIIKQLGAIDGKAGHYAPAKEYGAFSLTENL